MKPIKTESTNCILKGIEGVQDLPVTRLEYTDGVQAVESCWELSEEDKKKIAETGKIYLLCLSNTHPPIWLNTKSQLGGSNEEAKDHERY